MENRSGPVAAQLILAALLACGSAWADDGPGPEREAEWNSRLRQADELRREGAARKAAAEKQFTADEAACNRKLLVNICREDAKQRRIPEVNEARRLETEGRRMEQEVHQEQFADREARRAAEAPQKAADLERKAGETAKLRQDTGERIETQQQKKDRQAVEGKKRRAEREARVARKQADHAARVEEKQRQAAERKAAE